MDIEINAFVNQIYLFFILHGSLTQSVQGLKGGGIIRMKTWKGKVFIDPQIESAHIGSRYQVLSSE